MKNEKFNKMTYASLTMSIQDKNIYGGNIITNENPLRERMHNFTPDYNNHGGSYYLPNIQLTKDEDNKFARGLADFRDIFVLVESIDDEEKY